MTNNILFLFILFSPGLRGIGLFYYLLAILTFLSSNIFKSLIKFEWLKNFRRQNILYYLFILIYIFSFASIIRVPQFVSIREILVGILRLALPMILILCSTNKSSNLQKCIDSKNFERSLFIATFMAGFCGAASLYFQVAFSSGWDILNSIPLARADLIRYSSTLGNVNSAGLGIPIICLIIFYQKKCIYSDLPKKYISRIERFVLKIPLLPYISFLLFSTIFTLSRTAVINLSIVILITFIFSGFCSKSLIRIKKLNIKKIFYFFYHFLIGLAPFLFIYSQFMRYLKLNLSFLGITSNDYPVAYRNISVDIFMRVFDDRASRFFNAQDFLFGEGLHNAGGTLGFKQYNFFYHNTILNLYQIMGILGPILIIAIIFILTKRSIKYFLKIEDKNKLNYFLFNISLVILYIPNLFTFSGMFFVPLWIVPFIFSINQESQNNLISDLRVKKLE